MEEGGRSQTGPRRGGGGRSPPKAAKKIINGYEMQQYLNLVVCFSYVFSNRAELDWDRELIRETRLQVGSEARKQCEWWIPVFFAPK